VLQPPPCLAQGKQRAGRVGPPQFGVIGEGLEVPDEDLDAASRAGPSASTAKAVPGARRQPERTWSG